MKREQVCEICTNVSDMTGEEVAFLIELMLEKGAIEAWAEPVMVKKHSPAFRIVVQCQKERATDFCEMVLRNSTAAGITLEVKNRLMLDEEVVYVETSLGMVRVSKTGARRHIVYEDLARVAKTNHLSIAAAREKILEEFDS